MITTGFTIPEVVLKRLAAAVAAIHRQTATMTIAEFRKAYRKSQGLRIGCFVNVDYTNTGAVKSFQVRRIDKPSGIFRLDGFEADVPLSGRAVSAAKELALEYGEYLLRREISQRRNFGHRELVKLSNEELLNTAEELSPLKRGIRYEGPLCGTLSELLRLRVVEEEIKLRETESNHQRLTALTANAEYVTACEKRVEAEKLAAQEWREARDASPYYYFDVGYSFQKRTKDDQTVIAYRNAIGWRL